MGGRVAGLAAQVAAAAAVCVLLVYPVAGFVSLAAVPLAVRLAWPVLAGAAVVAPFPSLVAFVAVSPLLPILPVRLEWPAPANMVSLPEQWLFALVAGAALRIMAGRRAPGAQVPGAATVLLMVATASLAVMLYPFHVTQGGFEAFGRSLHGFLSRDFITSASQRVVYASIVSWAILAEGLGVLWLVLRTLDRRSILRSRWLLGAAAAGATVVAALGIVQWWTKSHLLPFWVVQDPGVTRINATFTDVNGLGAYLAMMAPALLAIAMWDPPAAGRRGAPSGPAWSPWWWRWAWRAGLVLVGVGVLFTASRAAWLAFVVGLAVYALGLARHGLVRSRWGATFATRRAVVTMLAACAVLLVTLSAYATIRDVRRSEVRSYATNVLYSLNLRVPGDERLKGRLELWSAAVRMIERHPFFGIGIGRYYKDLWAYAPRQEALPRPQENAHNYYLQVAAELGLAGLAAFLALGGGTVAAAWRAARSSMAAADRRAALACAAGISAFGVTLLTGHSLLLREGQFPLWTMAAIGLALARSAERSGREADQAPAGALGRPATGGTPAGWRGRRPSRAAIIAGASALVLGSVAPRAIEATRALNVSDLTFGLYPPELDDRGREQQWTSDSASLYLPATTRAFRFQLRSLAPFPQRVRVLLDGEPADEVRLADHSWYSFRYLIPRRRGASYRRLDLVVDPTWRPPNDPRELGVLIGEQAEER